MLDGFAPDVIRQSILINLEEATENVHGYFLDKGCLSSKLWKA